MNYSSRFLCAACLALAVAGCVDDDYDLSDIDTTVGVTVDQLVVPVNIDEITLDNIITLNETGCVKVLDGQYAIVQDGTFTSEVINVPAFNLKAPEIQPSETEVSINGAGGLVRAGSEFSYDLATEQSDYSFESDNVSDFIVSIDHIGCRMTLRIDVTLRGLEQKVRRIKYSGVVIQLPKGLDLSDAEGGSYNPATGIVTLPDRMASGNTLSLLFTASGLDFTQAGARYDYDHSSVTIPGNLYIKEGKAIVAASDIIAPGGSLPSNVTLRSDYTLSDVDVASFTGKVKYTIDNSSLSDVDLSDLPDVLAQESTDLIFTNPAIYLNVTSPIQNYGIFARTGLEVTAFHGMQTADYSIDDPWFQIGPDNADGIYNFCLAPHMPANPDPEFSPARHVEFTALSNVLSGNGIPERLSINLVDPNIPAQPVTGFSLGTNLGALEGKYRLVVPLQFADGSTIVYTDRIDGWMDDDLRHLTISELDVDVTVSTDVPVAIDFTGYPIGTDGKQIGNVEIVGANIDANADNQKVTLRITGEIRGLDGIVFEARARAVDGSALRPDMKIRLTDIRPRVSGTYEKEL